MPLVSIRTLVAAAFLAPSAIAGQTCVSASLPLTTTNWSQTVSIPRFNSSLGILSAIHVQLAAHAEGTAGLENLDNHALTALIQFSSIVTATRPDNSVILIAVPVQTFSPMLAPYDGTIDLAGPSGILYTGIAVDAFPSPTTTLASAADLALFTGPTSNPGVVQLGVSAAGSSFASGPGSLGVILFTSKAAAVLTVCYDYVPAVTTYCRGTNAACPCANGGFVDSGCRNSGVLGATLVDSGVASLSADTLLLNSTSMPAGASTLFFQGTTRVNGGAGTIFGDGLLCVGGTVTRLGIKTALAGSAQYPGLGDMPVSLAGGVAPGDVRTYQAWYRDAAVFCTSDTFNLTQGLEVTWVQ